MQAPGRMSPWRKRALRHEADRRLRWGAKPCAAAPLLEWRAAELTSARERKQLARSLRGVARELEGRTLPGPVPLNRAGALPHLALVRGLAERLADLEHPVAAAGILCTHDLLGSPDSPLYCRERTDELPRQLTGALRALDEAA